MAMGEWKILPVAMAYIFLVVSASGATHNNKKVGKETKEAEADRITRLPGQPKVSFQQYSGYVTVNKVAGRALFYWLTEAVKPQTKPLVIWFNGGPGCSSLAFGAAEEIGAFKIKKNGTGLHRNKFAWNTLANVLFVESPVGVGYSYTNTSSDLKDSNDHRTATDALEFVIRWLDRFPQYKQKEIYLSGESYAGHYVPQLAKEIMTYNSKSKNRINFKGILIGNPCIDNTYDELGTIDYMWSHAMISEETHSQLRNCSQNTNLTSCDGIGGVASQEMGKVDRYNIYANNCQDPDLLGSGILYRPFSIISEVKGYDPCTVKYAKIYFNRPDVQKALHANTTNIPYNWTDCSKTINRQYNRSVQTILPIYKDMIAGGLRVWVFSGDADSIVPITATKLSLAQLKLKIIKPWHPWFVKDQVGGRALTYEGLTLATVKGAGHEVALTRPKEALVLFKSFLSGTPLPEVEDYPGKIPPP